jgi:hypothetical protein
MSQMGWIKDKWDYRDYLYKIPVAVPLPDKVDLSQYLPTVRNQGNVGSCVGFGIGANLVSVVKKQNAYQEWYSPTWIYNGARALEGGIANDTGCSPRDACDWLLKNGCLLESFWPYDDSKLDKTMPSSERMAQASKYLDFAYYRVVDGVEGIKAALADGHFISIGSPWFHTWMNPVDGMLPEVTAENGIAGGHETCIYGYDNSINRFLCINSWGKDWGNRGLFTMSFSAIEVFQQVGGYDAHYFTFTVTGIKRPGCLPGAGILKRILGG